MDRVEIVGGILGECFDVKNEPPEQEIVEIRLEDIQSDDGFSSDDLDCEENVKSPFAQDETINSEQEVLDKGVANKELETNSGSDCEVIATWDVPENSDKNERRSRDIQLNNPFNFQTMGINNQTNGSLGTEKIQKKPIENTNGSILFSLMNTGQPNSRNQRTAATLRSSKKEQIDKIHGNSKTDKTKEINNQGKDSLEEAKKKPVQNTNGSILLSLMNADMPKRRGTTTTRTNKQSKKKQIDKTHSKGKTATTNVQNTQINVINQEKESIQTEMEEEGSADTKKNSLLFRLLSSIKDVRNLETDYTNKSFSKSIQVNQANTKSVPTYDKQENGNHRKSQKNTETNKKKPQTRSQTKQGKEVAEQQLGIRQLTGLAEQRSSVIKQTQKITNTGNNRERDLQTVIPQKRVQVSMNSHNRVQRKDIFILPSPQGSRKSNLQAVIPQNLIATSCTQDNRQKILNSVTPQELMGTSWNTNNQIQIQDSLVLESSAQYNRQNILNSVTPQELMDTSWNTPAQIQIQNNLALRSTTQGSTQNILNALSLEALAATSWNAHNQTQIQDGLILGFNTRGTRQNILNALTPQVLATPWNTQNQLQLQKNLVLACMKDNRAVKLDTVIPQEGVATSGITHKNVFQNQAELRLCNEVETNNKTMVNKDANQNRTSTKQGTLTPQKVMPDKAVGSNSILQFCLLQQNGSNSKSSLVAVVPPKTGVTHNSVIQNHLINDTHQNGQVKLKLGNEVQTSNKNMLNGGTSTKNGTTIPQNKILVGPVGNTSFLHFLLLPQNNKTDNKNAAGIINMQQKRTAEQVKGNVGPVEEVVILDSDEEDTLASTAAKSLQEKEHRQREKRAHSPVHNSDCTTNTAAKNLLGNKANIVTSPTLAPGVNSGLLFSLLTKEHKKCNAWDKQVNYRNRTRRNATAKVEKGGSVSSSEDEDEIRKKRSKLTNRNKTKVKNGQRNAPAQVKKVLVPNQVEVKGNLAGNMIRVIENRITTLLKHDKIDHNPENKPSGTQINEERFNYNKNTVYIKENPILKDSQSDNQKVRDDKKIANCRNDDKKDVLQNQKDCGKQEQEVSRQQEQKTGNKSQEAGPYEDPFACSSDEYDDCNDFRADELSNSSQETNKVQQKDLVENGKGKEKEQDKELLEQSEKEAEHIRQDVNDSSDKNGDNSSLSNGNQEANREQRKDLVENDKARGNGKDKELSEEKEAESIRCEVIDSTDAYDKSGDNSGLDELSNDNQETNREQQTDLVEYDTAGDKGKDKELSGEAEKEAESIRHEVIDNSDIYDKSGDNSGLDELSNGNQETNREQQTDLVEYDTAGDKGKDKELSGEAESIRHEVIDNSDIYDKSGDNSGLDELSNGNQETNREQQTDLVEYDTAGDKGKDKELSGETEKEVESIRQDVIGSSNPYDKSGDSTGLDELNNGNKQTRGKQQTDLVENDKGGKQEKDKELSGETENEAECIRQDVIGSSNPYDKSGDSTGLDELNNGNKETRGKQQTDLVENDKGGKQEKDKELSGETENEAECIRQDVIGSSNPYDKSGDSTGLDELNNGNKETRGKQQTDLVENDKGGKQEKDKELSGETENEAECIRQDVIGSSNPYDKSGDSTGLDELNNGNKETRGKQQTDLVENDKGGKQEKDKELSGETENEAECIRQDVIGSSNPYDKSGDSTGLDELNNGNKQTRGKQQTDLVENDKGGKQEKDKELSGETENEAECIRQDVIDSSDPYNKSGDNSGLGELSNGSQGINTEQQKYLVENEKGGEENDKEFSEKPEKEADPIRKDIINSSDIDHKSCDNSCTDELSNEDQETNREQQRNLVNNDKGKDKKLSEEAEPMRNGVNDSSHSGDNNCDSSRQDELSNGDQETNIERQGDIVKNDKGGEKGKDKELSENPGKEVDHIRRDVNDGSDTDDDTNCDDTGPGDFSDTNESAKRIEENDPDKNCKRGVKRRCEEELSEKQLIQDVIDSSKTDNKQHESNDSVNGNQKAGRIEQNHPVENNKRDEDRNAKELAGKLKKEAVRLNVIEIYDSDDDNGNISWLEVSRNGNQEAAKVHEQNAAENDRRGTKRKCGEELSKRIEKVARKTVLDNVPDSAKNVDHNPQNTWKEFRDQEKGIRKKRKPIERKKCPQCSKMVADMKGHIFTTHTNEKDYTYFRCDQCDYKSRKKDQLTRHVIYKHIPIEAMIDTAWKCDKCPKMFKNQKALYRHKRNVHRKKIKKINLECAHCEFKTVTKIILRYHMEDHIYPDKVHACPKCNFTTKSKNKFMRHKGRHRSDLLQCEVCSYTTPLLEHFRLHLLKHKDVKEEKDFTHRCDKCDYKTYRYYSLDVHKLNHLKPEEIDYFYCYHCNFKAKRKDNLKVHIHRQHFKECLKCYVCDFTAYKQDDLVRHIDKHAYNKIKNK